MNLMATDPAHSVAKPMKESDFYSEAAIEIVDSLGAENSDTFHQLMKSELFADACHWIASQFPVRYGVWWGLICATDSGVDADNETFRELLLRWVIEPEAVHQLKLLNLTWLDTPESPIEYLAKAVSWTGPSMLPTHLPISKPNIAQVTRMIAAAVDLSAAGHLKLEPALAYQRFLDFALDIDGGALSWEGKDDKSIKKENKSKPQSLFPSE
jgi:hypothetical protein